MSSLRLRLHHRRDNFSLDVDTRLETRGVTALFGPSGSGKTTLLDCIAGLREDIDDAAIHFDDECWQQGRERLPAWRRGIAYVFQDARLFPHLSVAGNLDYARRRAHGSAPTQETVAHWLDIEPLLDRSIDTLSAGQAQRVAIARALLSAPRLLLLDEPLANLDRAAARHCLACLLRVARDAALPMLYVSHRIEEISAIADHLLLLRDGRIEAEGPAAELLSRIDGELAEDEDAAALLLTEAQGSCADGLCEVRADDLPLWVSGTPGRGTQRLRVAARDVSVCRERPVASSILNILPVTLDSLRPVSSTHCLLRLRLREQFLLARITERSRRELALAPGDHLFAQIKSTALLDPVGGA